MNSKKIEQQALIGGVFVNLLMCCAGIAVYEITHIEAGCKLVPETTFKGSGAKFFR